MFLWIQIKHPKIQKQILLDQGNFSRFLWIQIKDKKILKAKIWDSNFGNEKPKK